MSYLKTCKLDNVCCERLLSSKLLVLKTLVVTASITKNFLFYLIIKVIEIMTRSGQMSYKMSGSSGMSYVMSWTLSYNNVIQ